MQIIADLHIHSKYSRACSKDLTPENLAIWAKKKGITVLGTGDFTHPQWLMELKEKLEESKPGLYQLRDKSSDVFFTLTAEVASIYKQGDKVRRVHNLLLAPNFAAVDRLIISLEKRGANLKADGRPIFGIPCEELMKMCKEADPNIEIVPAHAWTPHFGVFGSLSGFDSLEEAFGQQAKYIFAIETGLSSDPAMNWLVENLDNITLISNSDAHSLRKLGREANVFELDDLSFSRIISAINPPAGGKNPKEFLYTIEFFPEEGKYHLDGHRDCKFSCTPEKTKSLGGICPVCGKKLLSGVLSRVEALGNRQIGFKPMGALPFKSLIPLEEIIAETYNVGTSSKKVLATYEQMTTKYPEFEILINLDETKITEIASSSIAQSIMRVRNGNVHIEGGYDGVFGRIEIYNQKERQQIGISKAQPLLF